MAKCALGNKKHRRCEEILGKKLHICLVRGGWEHFMAECYEKIGTDGKGMAICKRYYVNYKTGEWKNADI